MKSNRRWNKSVILITVFLSFFGLKSMLAQESFITVWKTDNILNISGDPVPNTTDTNQFRFLASGDYNYTWTELDEVGIPTNHTGTGFGSGSLTLTFPHAGIYRMEITPTYINDNPFNRIYFEWDDGDCYKLIRLENWGDVEWSSMERAFYGASNLEITATDMPDLSQVTNMQSAFAITRMSSIANIDMWDVSNVTDMSNTFESSTNFNSPIGNWDVSNVTNMSLMFYDAESFDQPLENWDVSSVTTMGYMFSMTFDFNQPLASWDVSSVIDMKHMFAYALSFNQPLNDWDVSNVEDMSGMFGIAANFDQPLDNWDVSNVKNMSQMFASSSFVFGAEVAFNHPIENWDVSSVEDMSGMFAENHTFNQPLQQWDVHNVTDMEAMFGRASSFNQPLGEWDVDNVTNMKWMFYDAVSFNQPIGEWEVSNVVDMFDIFTYATSFNQSLENWNLNSLQPIYHGYYNNHISFSFSGMDCENYSRTLYGWSQNAQTASDITMHAYDLQYSTNEETLSSREDLAMLGWNIYGDTQGNCLLSLQEAGNQKVNIYPNPTQDQLYITGLQEIEKLQLIDFNGRLMRSIEGGSTTLSLNLRELSQGLYFLQINTKNGRVITKKVIKE